MGLSAWSNGCLLLITWNTHKARAQETGVPYKLITSNEQKQTSRLFSGKTHLLSVFSILLLFFLADDDTQSTKHTASQHPPQNPHNCRKIIRRNTLNSFPLDDESDKSQPGADGVDGSHYSQPYFTRKQNGTCSIHRCLNPKSLLGKLVYCVTSLLQPSLP